MRKAWVVCTQTFNGGVSGKEYLRGTVYVIVTSDVTSSEPLWRLENNAIAVFTNYSLAGRQSKFRMFDNEFLARAYAATLGG